METKESSKDFYCRMAKEQAAHAAILKEMYSKRKIKATALADAIWAGHWACKQSAEDFAQKAEQIKAVTA